MKISYPIEIRCDGKFDFLFYDIKAQLFPKDHIMSCQVEFSIRNLADNTDSISLALLPSLKISSITSEGDNLDYRRTSLRYGVEVVMHLNKPLKKGEEQTFRMEYSGELIAESGGYDGYVGEEGVFMRTFAAWYPYCTSGGECFLFPDVPYILEVRAPLGWTFFAHPQSPDVRQEGDQVIYRWDGRQPHNRLPHWGIVLIGGKYQKIERKIGENNITFFALEKPGKSMEKVVNNIGVLLNKLDEFSNMPSSPRQIQFAENPDFLDVTYQPTHTHFYSSLGASHPYHLTRCLIWDDVMEWGFISEADWVDPLTYDLGNHLYQWFWADKAGSPGGWLAADLERLRRGYIGIIQEKVQQQTWFDVHTTKCVWAWWIWRQMIGDEAFSRALHRLRTGAFPKDTVIGPKEFFELTSDEAGLPYDWFWEQWMERTSAPQIKCERMSFEERGGNFVVDITLHQPGDVYHLPLDIALHTDKEEIRQSIFMRERDYHLVFHCKGRPEKLQIDPERKIMKIPCGHPERKFFKPIDLGFEISFARCRNGASLPIEDAALNSGKRIVVAPTELMDVAEALKPYLLGRLSLPKPQELSGDAPEPIEIYSPEKVTDDLLRDHNLVIIGNPENNLLFEKMAISTMEFQPDRISAGEAMIEDEEQALIAFGENPQNTERFCLVVTALNSEALRQPPDFSEMPGDYLIYQDGKILKVGYQTLL